jgi:selenium metabolism protein YedF
MTSGETILVLVDNEAACKNISRFAESQGHPVKAEDKGGDRYHLLVTKGEGKAPAAGEAEIVCDLPDRRATVVYIGSDTMGRGDDDLGRKLMKVYLDTLSHFAREISHLIFVNSGVKLAVEGSPALDHLRDLADMGVEILSCGACLDHFGLKEKLAAGVVSNMYAILEVKLRAGRILSP